MIQYAAIRSCAASFRQGNLCRWQAALHRSRSVGPTAASNTVPVQQQLQREHQSGAEATSGAGEQGGKYVEYIFDHTPTTLGQDVSRMVRLGRGCLQPEIVDLMVGASSKSGVGSPGLPASVDTFVDTFAVIAKSYRRQNNQHLTLLLCEAFEERTGEPLVPSTPQGLVLLLDAMQPRTARHARSTRELGGERAVLELLRRYEQGGKIVGMAAYKAAVNALDGSDCMVALELAREARSKLGNSAEGLGELYTLVMKQCEKQQEPGMARAILEERIEAGGSMVPDGHAYALTLACLGKAKRVSEALEVFGEMLESGVKPNGIAINNLLAACARDAGDFWRHAKAIFEGMEQRWGVAPNLYHYTSLVTCLLKAGQWSDAIELTDRMEVDGITPNSRFLDHMMQASVNATQWVTAEAIFRAMTEKYGHVNVVSRQSTLHFIQSMVMQKKLRKAISYVSRAQHFSLKGPSPMGNDTMDTSLLKWFRTIPGVGCEALTGVLMTMIDKGVRLHPASYSVVISKANQDENKQLSQSLYKMLLAANGAPSLSATNAAIKGCASIEEALAKVESLREHGLLPDKFTYAALLHCCGAAVDDDLQGERATEVWQAMLDEGICPHGGMLASYLLALMKSGDWKTALKVRQRYRGGNEKFKLSHAERHVSKLDIVAREDAVVDGVVANGLVDNFRPKLALAYVHQVLKARQEEGVRGNGNDNDGDPKRFVDEDNHTVLGGIRACKQVGSCKIAMDLLAACEARWETGPLVRDADRGSGGKGFEGELSKQYEWREMNTASRLSRRRLYDSVISMLCERDQDFGDIRRVLESGMKNGAISLMKDQQGGTSAEQAVDFHGWSTRGAWCIVRCIVQDLAHDKDFLHQMGQYDLGRVVIAQGLREFGSVDDRWHVDSPDPRGRRRVFADGLAPARFSERAYGKGRKRMTKNGARWETPKGAWDGQGSDETQVRWWEKQMRLSLVVGKPRPPPCIRNVVEEFCTLEVSPPLRVRKAASNPGILTIEPEDVHAWLERKPSVLS